MKCKQHGYLDINFTGIFIALFLIGIAVGVLFTKGCSYISDHVDVNFHWIDSKSEGGK